MRHFKCDAEEVYQEARKAHFLVVKVMLVVFFVYAAICQLLWALGLNLVLVVPAIVVGAVVGIKVGSRPPKGRNVQILREQWSEVRPLVVNLLSEMHPVEKEFHLHLMFKMRATAKEILRLEAEGDEKAAQKNRNLLNAMYDLGIKLGCTMDPKKQFFTNPDHARITGWTYRISTTQP